MTEKQKDAVAITVCIAVALVAVVALILNIHVVFPVLWRTLLLLGGAYLLTWSLVRVGLL